MKAIENRNGSSTPTLPANVYADELQGLRATLPHRPDLSIPAGLINGTEWRFIGDSNRQVLSLELSAEMAEALGVRLVQFAQDGEDGAKLADLQASKFADLIVDAVEVVPDVNHGTQTLRAHYDGQACHIPVGTRVEASIGGNGGRGHIIETCRYGAFILVDEDEQDRTHHDIVGIRWSELEVKLDEGGQYVIDPNARNEPAKMPQAVPIGTPVAVALARIGEVAEELNRLEGELDTLIDTADPESTDVGFGSKALSSMSAASMHLRDFVSDTAGGRAMNEGRAKAHALTQSK